MVSAHDVAAYILSKLDGMSAMKLQKLVYYSQAWHLVWTEDRLFPEKIEAWANGPVVYELFEVHRGDFSVSKWDRGDPDKLTKAERGSVDAVIGTYGHLAGRKLSHLTHGEDPWRQARGNLGPTERSSAEITPAAMHAYYSAVDADDNATPVNELDWGPWEGQDPAAGND